MLKTITIALLLVLLPGCSALKARPVALPSELTAIPLEPPIPSLSPTNSEWADYSVKLWFAYRDAADKLRAIEGLQKR